MQERYPQSCRTLADCVGVCGVLELRFRIESLESASYHPP